MARKLGSLKPARFPEVAEQERRLWEATLAVFDRWQAYVWKALKLPGTEKHLAAGDPFVYTPGMMTALDRATHWFVQSQVGYARDAEAFAAPSNAAIDIDTPIYKGAPLLPGELRTAFGVGKGRAVRITGADAPALLGVRNEAAMQEMLKDAFGLLSEGARVRIGDVLTADKYPGGSVHELLVEAMQNGENPLTVARQLRVKFAGIGNYQWARLARTEISFSQNRAMTAEYTEEGFVRQTRANGTVTSLPPYHPNCVCGQTLDLATGFIIPDVSATACQVCQAHKAESGALLADAQKRYAGPQLEPGRVGVG